MRNHTKKIIAALALTLSAALGVAVPAGADTDNTVTEAGLRGWCC